MEEKVNKKYINIVKVWNMHEEKMEVFKSQGDYSFTLSPNSEDLDKTRRMDQEFIEIPSDEHVRVLVRMDDIMSARVIKNPYYTEVDDNE